MTKNNLREKEKFAKRVKDNVVKHGHHSIYVGPGKGPEFCYSVGLKYSYNLPEVFISALGPNLSNEIIINIVDRYKNGNCIQYNTMITGISSRFKIFIIKVPEGLADGYILAAKKFYKEKPFEVIQVVYPDINGKYPMDDGYDYDQVILGEIGKVKRH